jgi:hypothetical protein
MGQHARDGGVDPPALTVRIEPPHPALVEGSNAVDLETLVAVLP